MVLTREVHKLPQQLNRRLRPVNLQRWHVEVVDEEHLPLGGRGAEHAAPASLQLAVYYVLRIT